MKNLKTLKLLIAFFALTTVGCIEITEDEPGFEESDLHEMIQKFYESTAVSSGSPIMTKDQVTLSGSIDAMADGLTLKYGYAWMSLSDEDSRTEVILGSTDEPMAFEVNVPDFPKNEELGFCILVRLEFRDEEIEEEEDTDEIIESEFKTFTWENQ